MKYTVVCTDTADEQIRKTILYINENFGSEVALQKVDDERKRMIVYAVADHRQDYLNIIRGL